MKRCIAIYPEPENSQLIEMTKEYIECASSWSIEEVFTSIHLPELSMKEQIDYLMVVSDLSHQNKMELTVDIGGQFIKKALEDQSILLKLKEARIDFLRLDYGYTFEQLEKLYVELKLKGFVINASMVNEKMLAMHLEQFYRMDPNIQIRACHNFYVREESGLDEGFALSQTALFERKGIPVYYCIPCHHHPRGPLYLGLCTVEKHRWMPLDSIMLDLLYHYNASGIMLADPWFMKQDFETIQHILNENPININVKLNDDITEEEKRIVLQSHQFRYDSNQSFLRSRSSREMAEYASMIKPKEKKDLRFRGAITIDNSTYGRYSGELQVVLKNADADARVNLVGWIEDEKDMKKLEYYREGITYRFVENKDTAVKK